MKNHTSAKQKLQVESKIIFRYIAIGGLTIGLTVALVLINNLSNKIDIYRSYSSAPNPACYGIAASPYLLDDIRAYFSYDTDENKLIYTCSTGVNKSSKVIHGLTVPGYELGATAIYFESAEGAQYFADSTLQTWRYWSEDNDNEQPEIHSNRWTFIVTDEPEAYFDSYAVRENIVIRLSLWCSDNDAVTGGTACYEQAENAIEAFAERLPVFSLK